jgi:hypothetical protein
MRIQIHSISASAAALIGMAWAQSSQAAATQIDAASAVRGSLGVSLEDLTLSSGAGASVFFLNAGFALLFGLIAFMVSRMDGRQASRIPFRPTSNFAR